MSHGIRHVSDFSAGDIQSDITTDVCIIGGGATGITIARDLATTRQRVLLLESGGLEFEPDTQDLYAGRIVGEEYHDLDVARLRFFGGTTNHWTNQIGFLDPLDFEKRSWVPHI